MPLQLTPGKPCEQPFDPGVSPNLGKPSAEGYLSNRDGPNAKKSKQE